MRFLLVVALLAAAALAAPNSDVVSRLTGKIVGGEAADIADYPYQVSVQALLSHLCGGSILSARFVVTAAHCTIYPTSWYNIRAGSSLRNSGGQVISVSSISIHPDYSGSTLDNDIAILGLASDLTFGSGVAAVSLPVQDQEVAVGAESLVTGWGTLSYLGSSTNQLQVVTVPIVDRSSCATSYATLGYGVSENMICAGYEEGGKDACQGDSGGPLVIDGQLIGLVSWGEECALAGYPGVYASVPYLRSYIAEVTGL